MALTTQIILSKSYDSYIAITYSMCKKREWKTFLHYVYTKALLKPSVLK
jgi:hypothetical protein